MIYINSTPKPHEQDLLNQFADSVGLDVTHSKKYEPSDVAVIFGSWKKVNKNREHFEKLSHHVLKNDVVNNHRGKLVIFETPLLNRKIIQEHDSYRVGLNHYMRGLSDFKNKNSSPDRFNSMGIDIKGWRNQGDHVLVIGQNWNDASLFGISLELWIINTVRMLLKNTDRKIVVRDHPENKGLLKDIVNDIFGYTKQVIYDTNIDIKDSLNNAHCTVSYTSGSSIDSALAGVPVITCSEYNFLWPISSHSLEDVENPKLGERDQLFYDLAWTQWSVDDIKNGKPWQHLIGDSQ